MTRKRKTDNDLVVTPSASAAPARRSTVTRTRTRRAAEPAEVVAASAVEAAAITPQEPVVAMPEPSYQEIAQLAYSYWQARSCEGGSPDDDWLRAEQELRVRTAAVA
jgi:hypothetical protein